MDYEKAYKYALGKAKEWCNLPDASDLDKKLLGHMFPELKEIEDEKIRKDIIEAVELYKDFTQERKEHIYAWLGKQGEQKPDNVEPKFKDGQWIVWQDKCYKVNYNGCGYELVDQDGLSTSLEYGTIDENAHLWTIQEAKDSDIICSRHNTESFEWIGIFKSLDKEFKRVFFYGFWNNTTKSFSVCGNEAYVLYNDFSPATKEQKEILFTAMADAGYSFNFEKRELKKFEQKPAWSEEDEKQARQIERIVHDDGCTQKLQKQIADWFKSLKDRVQPRQELTQDDKQYLLVCKNALRKYQVSDQWDAEIIIRWLENKLNPNKD